MIYPREVVAEAAVEGEEAVLVVAEAVPQAEALVTVRVLHLRRSQKLPNSSGSKKSAWLNNTDNSILIFGLFIVASYVVQFASCIKPAACNLNPAT